MNERDRIDLRIGSRSSFSFADRSRFHEDQGSGILGAIAGTYRFLRANRRL